MRGSKIINLSTRSPFFMSLIRTYRKLIDRTGLPYGKFFIQSLQDLTVAFVNILYENIITIFIGKANISRILYFHLKTVRAHKNKTSG